MGGEDGKNFGAFQVNLVARLSPKTFGEHEIEMGYMSIKEGVQAYHNSIVGEHHRYRSWEHCYSYFRAASVAGNADRDHAALQLGFYLASWGMYRGSSFLLQHSYTVHLGVIDLLGESRFSSLWAREFGANDDSDLISTILDAVDGIKKAYRDSASLANTGQPTDTLVTKVILGTFGCLPACDRYFIDGFKGAGFSYSYLNRKFVERILSFSQDNSRDLREEQSRIEDIGGVRYPLMKLIDMYFWLAGFAQAEGQS